MVQKTAEQVRGLRTAYVNALDELWSVEIQASG